MTSGGIVSAHTFWMRAISASKSARNRRAWADNVRRAAEMARLLNDQGIHALVALISPMATHREQARLIVGAERYIEVYVRTRPEVCESRDPKGLYKQARQSTLSHFTGITSPYEAPTAAALRDSRPVRPRATARW